MDGTADADYNEWRIQKQEWIDMGSKENKVNDLRIRRAVPADLEGVTMVEAAAFPAAEAASGDSFRWRLEHLGDSFFVAELPDEQGIYRIIGLIDARPTYDERLTDELFENGGVVAGENQAIMGRAVLPEYQAMGVGSRLMGDFINEMKSSGYRHILLTCKEEKITYYERFGYENLGVSASVHGGARWYDMIRKI